MRDALLFLKEILKIFILALVIVLPIRLFLFQAFVVKGASMEPSFYSGDYLIVNEISYRFSDPQRGDVIVFHYPFNPRARFIKRIIGLPGETIRIDEGKVKIFNDNFPQGKVLDESSYLGKDNYTPGNLEITLGQNQYFVMGDNREFSFDSREWGPLERKYIIGKVGVRLFSLEKLPHLKIIFSKR